MTTTREKCPNPMNLLNIQKLLSSADRVMRGFRISYDRNTGKPTGWMQPDNCREADLTELSEQLKLVKANLEEAYLNYSTGYIDKPQDNLESQKYRCTHCGPGDTLRCPFLYREQQEGWV